MNRTNECGRMAVSYKAMKTSASLDEFYDNEEE